VKNNIFYGLCKKEKICLVKSIILAPNIVFLHTSYDKLIVREMNL
jgi:hypothetical protein